MCTVKIAIKKVIQENQYEPISIEIEVEDTELPEDYFPEMPLPKRLMSYALGESLRFQVVYEYLTPPDAVTRFERLTGPQQELYHHEDSED